MSSAADSTEAYHEVDLGEDRLEGCLALSTEARWNQVAADWRMLLSAGRGVGLVRTDGTLVGSAVVLPHGDALAWIGMVLVTESERRRGHASRLMRWCLDRVESTGAIAGLDATPDGREVYRKLGFTDVAHVVRMQSDGPAPGTSSTARASIRAMGAADLDNLAAYDGPRFGAPRPAVLQSLHARVPDCALLAEHEGKVAGYVLARDGRVATQVGPLMAEDAATAEALLAAALERVEGPVFVDLLRAHDDLARTLTDWGFQEQRPFSRMLLGHSAPVHDPARMYLSAGPELA